MLESLSPMHQHAAYPAEGDGASSRDRGRAAGARRWAFAARTATAGARKASRCWGRCRTGRLPARLGRSLASLIPDGQPRGTAYLGQGQAHPVPE
jgi:hypothetical protein